MPVFFRYFIDKMLFIYLLQVKLTIKHVIHRNEDLQPLKLLISEIGLSDQGQLELPITQLVVPVVLTEAVDKVLAQTVMMGQSILLVPVHQFRLAMMMRVNTSHPSNGNYGTLA